MKRIATALVTRIGTDYAQSVTTGGFELLSDEPVSAGGRNAGPAPYGLVLIHIARMLSTDVALDDAQWDKLIEIAGKTPVTKTLQAGATITAARAHP